MRSLALAGAALLLFSASSIAQPATQSGREAPTARTPDTTAVAPESTVKAPSSEAQNPPANKDAPANPAVKTGTENNPGAPVAGANSFTEAQAKSRIEAKGFANVSSLIKDDKGVWRGKADQGGTSVDVSLDYQGNVVAR